MPESIGRFYNECKSMDDAYKTHNLFLNLVYSKGQKEWLAECPVPCNQTVYDLKLQKYHRNTIAGKGNMSQLQSNDVVFTLHYEKFVTEEHVETLIYDTGNFLAQAGGNLGLFLGFSCLSVFFEIINCVKKILNL